MSLKDRILKEMCIDNEATIFINDFKKSYPYEDCDEALGLFYKHREKDTEYYRAWKKERS